MGKGAGGLGVGDRENGGGGVVKCVGVWRGVGKR